LLLNLENADDEKEQWVQCELLSEDGKPLPGYSLAECDRVTENGITVPVTWQGKSSLSGVPTDVIRVRVRFHGGRYREDSPRLYALYFSQPPEIEQ